MSQQTINVGASPNDGTGTPLRTAFQYTNSNFSELYTALGGGSGLPGATTQVIFNDGGTNLAGDAGLVYNKTTDALTIGGNVQAASATITGDLTVDTSTLKVDSTNNRVGINTASPGFPLDVKSATAVFKLESTTGTNAAYLYATNTGGDFYFGRDNSTGTTFGTGTGYSAVVYSANAYPMVFFTNAIERYRIASDGVATWSNVGGVAGTAMTLNSTGLGVGLTPASGDGSGVFKAAGTGSGITNTRVGLDVREITSGNAAGIWLGAMNNENTGVIGSRTASGNIAFQTFNGASWGERMRIDYLGNVGIGVTPSAWGAGNKFIDINSSAAFGAFGASDAMMIGNAYWDGSSWIRKTANNAWRFVIESVSSTPTMTWQLAANGSAGSSISSWTQAMTLDASGNLGVGVAAASNTRTHFKGSSTSTDYITYCVNSGDKLVFAARNDGLFITGSSADSATLPNSPYNLTSGSAANVYIDSQGIFYRSTSSLKYKTEIADSIRGLADVLKLRPVTYKAKNSGDTVFGGLIAEEVDAAGLTEFVQYAPDKTPDAIHYGNMVSLLVSAIQELAAEVNALKNA